MNILPQVWPTGKRNVADDRFCQRRIDIIPRTGRMIRAEFETGVRCVILQSGLSVRYHLRGRDVREGIMLEGPRR